MVCVLLAEYWQRHGHRLTRSRTLLLLNIDSVGLDIMSELYESMDYAYRRLEKQTKDALIGDNDTQALSDAARELLGGNFTITQDPVRLQNLLELLHDKNVHQLLVRLAAKEHIDRTVKNDRRALAAQKHLEEVAEASILGEEMHCSEQAGPVEKGKNYKKNKRTAERRKNAKKAENNQAAVAQNPTESKEVANSTAASVTQSDECLVGKETTMFPTSLEPLTQIEFAASNGSFQDPVPFLSNAATPSSAEEPNTALSLSISGSSLSPLGVLDPDNATKASLNAYSSKAVLDSESTELNIPSSSGPTNQESSNNFLLQIIEDHHASILSNGDTETGLAHDDDHGWKQVQGKRKKYKKDKRNEGSSNIANASSSVVSLRFYPHGTFC